MGMHYPSAVSTVAPAAAPNSHRSFDVHNAWIRNLREDFKARISVASEDCEEGEGAGRWSYRSEPEAVDVDSIAWGHDELAPGGELAGAFDRALDFDDFHGPPVYRSVGLVSGDLRELEDEDEASAAPRRSAAEVEAQWLSEMPPLVCRQNAFAAGEPRSRSPW